MKKTIIPIVCMTLFISSANIANATESDYSTRESVTITENTSSYENRGSKTDALKKGFEKFKDFVTGMAIEEVIEAAIDYVTGDDDEPEQEEPKYECKTVECRY